MVERDPGEVFETGGYAEVVFAYADDGGVGVEAGEDGVGVCAHCWGSWGWMCGFEARVWVESWGGFMRFSSTLNNYPFLKCRFVLDKIGAIRQYSLFSGLCTAEVICQARLEHVLEGVSIRTGYISSANDRQARSPTLTTSDL